MSTKNTQGLFTAEEVLELLRFQKHDNLNHFQVILGFLQLGKFDRALNYVKHTIENISQNGKIMLLGCPYLSVTLLKKQLYAQRNNIYLNFELTDRFLKQRYINNSFVLCCERLINLVEENKSMDLERKDVLLRFDRLNGQVILELSVKPCFNKEREEMADGVRLLLKELDNKGLIKERYCDEKLTLIITLPEKSEVE
ncbi:MAG TPA: hypothetical protein DEA47_03535 [Peptococcaceae bacterium]|nr:MAG: Signal transduction histidine kinase regulating citrate/malate metabolism [Clostridia bacterium 41_269]HBT20422.1 hypothetical protein [Peptococcaceae bacterium]